MDIVLFSTLCKFEIKSLQTTYRYVIKLFILKLYNMMSYLCWASIHADIYVNTCVIYICLDIFCI